MLFLKNQSIQFLKALRIKQLQDFCFLKYIMGFEIKIAIRKKINQDKKP